MNNTENNRLIAEFMGYNEEIVNGEIYFTLPDMLESLSDEELQYHSDWNWLMEVVEKIENYNEYTNVLFTPQGCEINCYIENGFLFSNDCNTKIEAVYNACIEFIKWYNKQK
jgi:predicted HTH transcriptional regulator